MDSFEKSSAVFLSGLYCFDKELKFTERLTHPQFRVTIDLLISIAEK